ncbi:MAG: gerKB1 [Clostridiaceae bacterium]|jgi:spore germination protein (amino acid permease)|nr:gerKB1 [Clostridiaceae bacterium]
MREKGIISTNQTIWLLFCIITSIATMHIPRLLILQARRDAWLSVIFAWFLDVLLAIVYAYMGIRFPGQNMIQYSITIFGKRIGGFIGALFSIFFLLNSAALQRGLSFVLNGAFFPRTPEEIILISSYVVIGYGIIKGIEVIGRVCEILGPIYLFSLISLFLLVMPDMKITRLKPQLELGLSPSLTATPLILSFLGLCIMMGMFIPICSHPETGFISKFIAVTMGASTIILLIVGSIGVFGLPQSKNMINISLELARVIHIGGFIERVEAIWLMTAIGGIIVTCANMIWAFSLGISQIIGLNTYKPIVFPAILVSYVISITSFKNSLDLVTFAFYSFPIIAIFVETGLEITLFFAALILKKRG